MSAVTGQGPLHRGRLVLGVLLLLLATATLLQEAGVLTLQLRYLAPALLVTAGLVLLVSSVGRGAEP